MNETWNNFSEKISNTAEYLYRETEKFGDRAKLRYKIITAKKKLDSEYCRFGKIKYTEMKNIAEGIEIPEELYARASECMESIKTMTDEITEFEKAYKTAQNP